MRCRRRKLNSVWNQCHNSPSSRKSRESRRRRRRRLIRARQRFEAKREAQRVAIERATRAAELREVEREAECERVRVFEEMDDAEADIEFFSGAASFEEFLSGEPKQIVKFELGGFAPEVLDAFVKDVDFLSPITLMDDHLEVDHSKTVPELLDRVEKLRMNAFRQVLTNSSQCQACNDTPKPDFKECPLIFDSGASFGLTPFKKDFIKYEEVNISVKDVTKTNTVTGFGVVMYKLKNTVGEIVYVPGIAYHLESTDIRLLSPQAYHQLHGGSSTIDENGATMILGRKIAGQTPQSVHFPIDKASNLPMLSEVYCTTKERKLYGPQFRVAAAYLPRRRGYFTGKWSPTVEEVDASAEKEVEYEFSRFMHKAYPCVSHSDNENLTSAQKELLLWHWKLGIGLAHCQKLMRSHSVKDKDGKTQVHPPFIPPKIKTAATCPLPKCGTCELARAKKKSSPKPRTAGKAVDEREHLLAHDNYEAGDCIMTDEYSVPVHGRKLTGYGKGSDGKAYVGGGLYVDVASGYIHNHFSVDNTAAESLRGKDELELDLEHFGVGVKRYHSDNGVFNSTRWKQDCADKGQTQTFSGVGAQFENGVAERAIQTVMWMARSFMLHSSMRWNEHDCDDTSLWPFAVQHAVYLYNRIPGFHSGMSPLERITGQKADNRDLLRAHVWGCPAYVLDPRLQSGKKIPKFDKRARLGQFLGFSNEHSSLVALVRHLETGYVSPQWHVVFDDLYQTVSHNGCITDAQLDILCEKLFEDARDWYCEVEVDENGEVVYDVPPLDEIWLDEEERRDRQTRIRAQKERNRARMKLEDSEIPTPPEVDQTVKFEDVPLDGKSVAFDDDCVVFEGDVGHADFDPTLGDPPDSILRSPQFGSEGESGTVEPIFDEDDKSVPDENSWSRRLRPRKSRDDPYAALAAMCTDWDDVANCSPRTLKMLSDCERSLLTPNLFKKLHDRYGEKCTFKSKQVPVILKSKSRKKRQYADRINARLEEADRTLMQMQTTEMPSAEELLESPLGNFIKIAASESDYSGDVKHLICAAVSPLFLKAKAEASKEDNPNWREAIYGPHGQEYWEACKVEVATLDKMDTYEVVKRPIGKNVLMTTWAFKLKRFPDGRPKKFKARLCARGDQQTYGEDYTETYSPTAQWTTIRLMLLLEVILDLKSMQGDVTAAFLHGKLDEDEHIYVEMPRGFKQEGKVWKLKKSLYGLKQAPLYFFKYLVESMKHAGLKQSTFDPCCFVSEKVICVAYVDDCLFWAKDQKDINDVCDKLREDANPYKLLLEEEGDCAGFLGVDIKREDGKIVMTQTGLIDRIITALGLDEETAYTKPTPAEAKPLTKDLDGDPPDGTFNYASVVGMTLYLAGHTRPDITYAINCCARYMFNPRRSHEVALKRIGRYLKATRDKGLIMKPSSNRLKIDAWPDADFAGLFGHEAPNDPVCVKSRTGYVIQVADCPIIWKSQLQSNRTATSTMEAEITALAACCRELFPIMDMVESVSKVYKLKVPPTTMNVSIHEDNAGALVLAETIPPNFTPRSKWYHVETIWFREQIAKRGIKLVKCPTIDQLGDIFTKGLPRATFEHLRKKLCGW